MFKKITETLPEKISENASSRVSKLWSLGFFFVLFVLPMLFAVGISLAVTYQNGTLAAHERHQSGAHLAATVIRSNLDHLKDLTVSFASRVVFRERVAEGKWEEAIALIQDIITEFPLIDRVFITDLSGIEKADHPSLPGAVGSDFSYRDWYKGVSSEWKPYISEAYRRQAQPQYNVVAAATPIRDSAGNLVGILVVQVRLDSFFSWIDDPRINEHGAIYVIDQHNQLAFNKFANLGLAIRNLSESPSVKALRSKGSGTMIATDATGAKVFAAFAPVPTYDWGVIVEESPSLAFAERNKQLAILSVIFGIVLAIGAVVAKLFLEMLRSVVRSKRKEAMLLRSIGDGVVAIDRYWNITLWNEAAAEISGWTKDEVMGKPLRSFLRFLKESNREENMSFIERAMAYGKVSYLENSTVLVTKSGKEVPVSDSASPIISEDGKVEGAIIVFRNITKEQEASLLRSDFAYASHQLNTPVTKALWNIERVLEETNSEKIREKMLVAYKSAKSLQRLTEELLEVSKLDQRIVHAQPEQTTLREIISKAQEQLGRRLMDAHVSIETRIPNEDILLVTDKKLFSNIILEVLDNAATYSKPGGSVILAADAKNEELLISVKNDGIGVPESEQTLVFNKFFRGINFNSTEIDGAGLGLYIAKGYCTLLGGKMWFESKEGQGATFYISLPLSR